MYSSQTRLVTLVVFRLGLAFSIVLIHQETASINQILITLPKLKSVDTHTLCPILCRTVQINLFKVDFGYILKLNNIFVSLEQQSSSIQPQIGGIHEQTYDNDSSGFEFCQIVKSVYSC